MVCKGGAGMQCEDCQEFCFMPMLRPQTFPVLNTFLPFFFFLRVQGGSGAETSPCYDR